MKMTTMATVIALGLSLAGGVAAQEAAAPTAEAPVSGAIAGNGLLPGATAAPECGTMPHLAGRAFCVTAPLAAVGGLAEAYIARFESQGWLAAAGDDNRIVMIKRRDGGGCDGLQILAYYDETRTAGPESPGYLAMELIPGDVCAGGVEVPAEPAAPATPQ